MNNKQIWIILIFFICLSNSLGDIIARDVIKEKVLNNGTTPASNTDKKYPTWTGFLGCFIATVFFGSNLLPVKQFSAGDGFFFQFVYCVAVWAVGNVLDLILGNQRFYPLVMIGGVLWTTGNLVTVFCIKTCGLSVGILIWATTSLIMGWAGGRFGIFGLTPQVPPTTLKLTLNYLGVVFAAVSGITFLFIKSTNTPRETNYTSSSAKDNEIELQRNEPINTVYLVEEDTDFPFLSKLSQSAQKVVGCTLAALAGLFYGLMFIPDQYIRDHPNDYHFNNQPASKNGLHYINSQYSGILLSSLLYFVIYSALKRNKPSINPSIAIPAMISGIMWAIANIGFILAISTLSSAVAYPIVNVLPGIVSSLWSLFWFKEIQGMRNYIFLSVGMILRILAAVFSGLSS